MSFFGLIAHNVRARWVRSLLTALAVLVLANGAEPAQAASGPAAIEQPAEVAPGI